MASTISPCRILSICLVFTTACTASFATGSDRTIAQYVHTAWSQKEGAPSGVLALAQTSDGFLWVGSVDGLYRFDGLTFELRSPGRVDALFALPNGDLWIGRDSAVDLLRDGSITKFAVRDGVPAGKVASFAVDGAGTVWVATNAGLARLEGARWKQVGSDWNFNEAFATGMLLDRHGTFWVAAGHTILYLPRGSRRFVATGITVGQVWTLADAPNGKLWMSETSRSVRPVPLEGDLAPSDNTEFAVGSIGILFGRDGALWISTLGDGMRRVPFPERVDGGRFEGKDPAIESFTEANGLSDDVVTCILQDREGNIWVGTNNGLDRFYESKIVPVVLPFPAVWPVMAPGDSGSVWVSSGDQNFQIDSSGKLQIQRPGKILIQRSNKVTAMSPWERYMNVYRTPDGALFWSKTGIIDRIEPGSHDWSRVTRILTPVDELAKNRQEFQITEDRNGVIWAASDTGRIYSFSDGQWKRIDAVKVSRGYRGSAAFTDSAGRVWLGFADGTVVLIESGMVKRSWSGQNSPVGRVVSSITGRGKHVWVGGDRLAYFDGENFYEVTSTDGHFKVWGIAETQDRDLWLCENRGVVHIDSAEVNKFLKDHTYPVQYEIYDSMDGLPGSFRDVTAPSEVQGTDGRIWFSASKGIAWIDPAGIQKNMLPPPVSIRSMKADSREYSATGGELPPQTTALEIDYTALSLSIPERVQFRYKLEGVDKQWEAAGTRRAAFYTMLGPGRYRFQVIACNNDGVWNEVGAHLDFRIAPAWYQTIWFRSACAILFGLFLWGLYQLRLQQLRRQFNMRLEASVHERTRIARELHDTLLQSLHGLMFEFQAARNLFRKRPEEALQALDGAIMGTEQAITESQDAIQNLRTAPAEDDLGQLIRSTGEELAARNREQQVAPAFGLTIEGRRRELTPAIQDEIYRIAREVLRNAFRHAQARRIEAEILYDDDQLRLRVRDNGKGMEPEVLMEGGRPGHWGLPGVRERAAQIGAKLDVWSEAGAGSEIQLSVPASVAYLRIPARSRFRAFRMDRRL